MRLTRPFGLLALTVLLAPRVEASRTSTWEPSPPASLTAARADAAGLLASLAPAATADAELTEPPLFNLGDVILADTADTDAERFDLGPLTLVDLNLLRGPPPSYPETRVGGFELLPPFRVGASPSLSLWGRKPCGSFSCGLVSDSPEDPWGLEGAPTPVPCPLPAPGHGCFEGTVSTGSSFSLAGDRRGYVRNLQKAGLGTQQTQKLASERFPISSGEKQRYEALRGGIHPLQTPVEVVAAIELLVLTGFVPMEASGPLALIGSGSEMAASASAFRAAAQAAVGAGGRSQSGDGLLFPVLESAGASTRGSTFVSATAQTARSVRTSVMSDLGEVSAYKEALLRNEIGLQRPLGANVPGVDFITAARDPTTRLMEVITTDAKTSSVGVFPAPRPGAIPNSWMQEVFDAVGPQRLSLGDAQLEGEIRAAVGAGRVRSRQLNVDFSPAGQGQVSGF